MNYMAPEVINEEEQGFGLDTWAAGCMLFKMLTCHVTVLRDQNLLAGRDVFIHFTGYIVWTACLACFEFAHCSEECRFGEGIVVYLITYRFIHPIVVFYLSRLKLPS